MKKPEHFGKKNGDISGDLSKLKDLFFKKEKGHTILVYCLFPWIPSILQ